MTYQNVEILVPEMYVIGLLLMFDDKKYHSYVLHYLLYGTNTLFVGWVHYIKPIHCIDFTIMLIGIPFKTLIIYFSRLVRYIMKHVLITMRDAILVDVTQY